MNTSQSKADFTALFIRRPVMALVLNALIVVAGLAAYYGVDVREELPDVDRPVVTVSTDFESAAAETVDRELTSAIEGAVSRVSGVKSISSSSSFGNSRVTVEFNDDVDLNVAAADMRDAISRISNTLPDDAVCPASSRPMRIPTRSCASPLPPTRWRSRTCPCSSRTRLRTCGFRPWRR